MEEYKISIEGTAEKDLLGILQYVSENLKQPTVAEQLYGKIKKEINSLRKMPAQQKIVNEEPYASHGVRRLFVENYTIFYTVDASRKTVHVFRILYSRREWQNLLSD